LHHYCCCSIQWRSWTYRAHRRKGGWCHGLYSSSCILGSFWRSKNIYL